MNPEEIKNKFLSIKTKSELADFINIPSKDLDNIAKLIKYYNFEIPKKDGSSRKISAPNRKLKKIQKEILKALEVIYLPRSSAHGFIKGKSIVSNARNHIKSSLVLKIDLENFFPSIHFGRVRGLFLYGPFNFSSEIATVLARLCCYNGSLPQGSPTSPIISNMICSSMDKSLYILAKKNNCRYTRYSDDITFSTKNDAFKDTIVSTEYTDEGFNIFLGDSLVKIIEKENRLKINQTKTSCKKHRFRQKVTGIVINEKANVKSQLSRQIRSMLHAWDKFGYKLSERKYYSEFYKPSIKIPRNEQNFSNVVLGKISFLGMVKGKDDSVYKKYINKFNFLSENNFPKLPASNYEEIEQKTWIIKCGDQQGSGSAIGKNIILTCYHVIEENKNSDYSAKIEVFQSNNLAPATYKEARVIKFDPDKDWAILEISKEDFMPIFKINNDQINIGTRIDIAGFPHYKTGNSATIESGAISSKIERYPKLRYKLDKMLFSGHSGGPILNEKGEIIGIIVTGADNLRNAPLYSEHALIPMSEIKLT